LCGAGNRAIVLTNTTGHKGKRKKEKGKREKLAFDLFLFWLLHFFVLRVTVAFAKGTVACCPVRYCFLLQDSKAREALAPPGLTTEGTKGTTRTHKQGNLMF
jgi:hypothetical protein